MIKKDIFRVLDIASFIMVFVATGLFLMFEFVGDFDLLYFSVIIYFIGIIMLTAVLIFRICDLYKSQKAENNGQSQSNNSSSDDNSDGESDDDTKKDVKREKINLFTKLGFCVIAFVCMLIVLIYI